MDHNFERKLTNILTRILEDVEYRETYDSNVPNRRLEGILGGRTERPIIQKVGLLLDTRGLVDVSAWEDALKAIDAWFYENAQNVDTQCELSLGIISAGWYSFKQLDLYPLGFCRHLQRDLSMTMNTDVHDWTEALTIFCPKASLRELDLLILGLPSLPESVAEDKALELKRLLRPMDQRIVWFLGTGSADTIKSFDPTGDSRCLDYPQAAISCGAVGMRPNDRVMNQSPERNSNMNSQPDQSQPSRVNAKRFNRGLSEDFMRELMTGCFKAIREEAARRKLDIKIRDGYINVYKDGCSVLKLRETPRKSAFEAIIHRKYLTQFDVTNLPHKKGKDYLTFAASTDFVNRYVKALDTIIADAGGYRKREATIEERLIKANNQAESLVLLIDRQIQDPMDKEAMVGNGTSDPCSRGKADLLGLTQDESESQEFVLIELKQGLDNRIQHLNNQIGPYYHVMTDDHGCIKDAMWKSYRQVIAQSCMLGILPAAMHIPETAPAVIGLLVLYGYNKASELLTRLRDDIAKNKPDFPLYLVLLEEGQDTLPPKSQWEKL